MQPDSQRGHVGIELDRPRVLIFDNRATWELVKAWGAGFMAALYERTPEGAVNIKDLAALEHFLLVGLRRDAEDAGEELMAEQVAGFIRPLTIQPIFAALLVALTWTPERARKNGHAAAGEAPAAASQSHRTLPRRNASHWEDFT